MFFIIIYKLIFKVIRYKDRYHVLDWKSKNVFLFDSGGKYMRSLAEFGRGPRESQFIGDYFIDPYGSRVGAFDFRLGKIIFSDLEYNYLSERRFGDIFCNSALAIGLDKFVATNYGFSDMVGYLIQTNNFQTIVRSHLFTDIDFYKSYSHPNTFTLRKGNAFFCDALENKIYEIEADTIALAFCVDLGVKNLTREELRMDKFGVDNLIRSGKRAGMINSFHLIDEIAFFSYRQGLDRFYHFHDITTGKGVSTSNLLVGGYYVDIFGYDMEEDCLLAHIRSNEINSDMRSEYFDQILEDHNIAELPDFNNASPVIVELREFKKIFE